MGKTNSGRNQSRTCPCGSGEKYDKCCGIPPKVIDLALVRWRKTAQELRRRLGEFADRDVFMEEANQAQDIYLAGLDPELVDHEDEFTLERCFEWFIFDYRLSDGRTVLEHFAQEEKISDNEQVLLGRWRQSRLSVHEVVEVRAGEGIVVRDLVSQAVYRVRDLNAALEIEQGSVLFMRVLAVGDEYEFSTSGLALPGSYRDVLMFHLQRDLREYLKRRRGATPDQYLAQRAHVINKWVVDLGLLNRQPRWNPDGSQRDPLSLNLAQKLTNAFLDDYYERWLDRNIPALGGGTPRNLSRTGLGRQRLEELLRELDLIEEDRARRGEPFYDVNRVRAKLGLQKTGSGREAARGGAARLELMGTQAWPEGGYGEVARSVSSGMRELGFDKRQEGAALQLWHDYCSKERPLVRKVSVWSASVVYALSRLELNSRLKQKDLAAFFGVSISSISGNFRSLCRSLGLDVFDSRYATRSSPLKGRTGRIPLLDYLLRGEKS
ncbi:MAG TPA: SEC-C metal-binding domain-containing protein [Spirochaetia bacterium]|nr:SEC-C metal-binding domain-containing protein [Spirochaetia bacterium]